MRMKKTAVFCISGLAGLLSLGGLPSEACTRAVYLGPENMVVTGRTMDWREDIQTNLYLFPRGMERVGADKGNTLHWKSKYGSVIAAGYDIGTSDFATVEEAVAELKKETFRIDAPDMPNGAKSTMHLSISDATGNSAIFEYIGGKLVIHEGRECQVMTNSPVYSKQMTLDDYWQQIGGLVMLPGTNRASDRFVRASFYINAIPQTSDPHRAVAGVFSVMRNVSVPLGISVEGQPNISSTRWRSVSDQKNKVYYFETTLTPNVFWVNLNKMDFREGAPVRKLSLVNGEIYAGDTASDFKESKPFKFLFESVPAH